MLAAEIFPFCRLQPERALARGRGIAKISRLRGMLEQADAREDSREQVDFSKLEAVALSVETDAVRSRMPKVYFCATLGIT